MRVVILLTVCTFNLQKMVLNDILQDSSLTVNKKEEKISKLLNSKPQKGVPEAVNFMLNTNNSSAASFPANYLALLPNFKIEKCQVVEHILNNQRNLLASASYLIPDMSDLIVKRVLNEFFQDSSDSGMFNLAFMVSKYFPEKLQDFSEQVEDIESEYRRNKIQKLMLPGSPDDKVDTLFKKYNEDGDIESLKTLAWIRTDRAISAMLILLPEIPDEERADFFAYIESSGVFPDSRLASIYFKNYRGYIVSRDESPHHIGGSYPYSIPMCPVTNVAATRILTLNTSQLDLGLKSPYHPTFFWYETDYPPDCLYVQFTENGTKGIATLMTNDKVGTDLIRGELALKLEEYPLKEGYGGEAIPGFSRHQVGGYPHWINFERFPRCPSCGQGMQFLASIDSGMTPFGRLGFEGILYGFWCDSCDISCTYRQTDDDY